MSKTEHTINELDQEVKTTESTINNLKRRLDILDEIKVKLRSEAFFQAHSITIDDVETMKGEGKPFFATWDEMIEWLKHNSTKPWVEWNGGIHRRDVFMVKAAYCPAAYMEYLEDAK